MSAQVEDLDTIQPWKQANQFSLTLRGHWSSIPESSQTVTLDDYDPDDIDNVAPQIREIASDGNYNYIYDSFYAPVDFQLSGIAVKIPEFLPNNIEYRISVSVNGSKIETFSVPEDQDHNQKQYAVECKTLIHEDDFIQVNIEFSGDYELLSFNEHNAVFTISGCVWYGMYKQIFADVDVLVATTENITLSNVQSIDGFYVQLGDWVLVKNQTTASENGIWEVKNSGAWTRPASYPTLASLYDQVIYVQNGTTQNSIDTNNYVFTSSGGSTIQIPLMDWETGDKWYKTNIHLQNRSGNDILTDRVFIDNVKVTHDFLIQGASFSIWTDPLMVTKKYKTRDYCLYLDILVNSKSILPFLNFPRPIVIDMDDNQFKEYDIEVFNDMEGYPVRFGDNIVLKIYQPNKYIRTNGKVVQCSLYGCGPDCATLDSILVSVYEPCDDNPCEWKYSLTEQCDPASAKAKKKNPVVQTTTPSSPVERDYVTVDGLFVTVNGERVYI